MQFYSETSDGQREARSTSSSTGASATNSQSVRPKLATNSADTSAVAWRVRVHDPQTTNVNFSSTYTEIHQAINGARERISRMGRPARLTVEGTYTAAVLEVAEEAFTAEVSSADGAPLMLEFATEDLPVDDRLEIVAGSLVHLTFGVDRSRGAPRRVQALRLQRLGVWRKDQVERRYTEATEFEGLFDEE